MDQMEGIVYGGESGEETACFHGRLSCKRENQETTAMSLCLKLNMSPSILEKVKQEMTAMSRKPLCLSLNMSASILEKESEETKARLRKPRWFRLKQKPTERLRKERWAKMWEEVKHERWKQRMMTGDIAVNALIAMSSRKIKFFISGNGHKVPISFLEGKVVGLFFYCPRTPTRVFFELAHMYGKLREMGQNFEIVFVCIHDCADRSTKSHELLRSYEASVEKSFYKYFMGNTWLALPFSHTKTNRILCEWRGFRQSGEVKSDFVIIQPGQNFAHTCPMEVYEDYGIQAYPFSKSRATEIEVARLKSLTLDQVLFSGAAAADEKFVYDHDGQKISASLLAGKNILLFFTSEHGFDQPHELLYEKVIQSYIERKCSGESFEMLHVLYKDKDKDKDRDGDEDEDDQILKEAYKRPCKKMPCLEFPYDKYDDLEALYSKLLVRSCGRYYGIYYYIPMFVAFGQDGRFITMRIVADSPGLAHKDFDYNGLNLFSADDLYAQVRDYIAIIKEWSTDDEDIGRSKYSC